MTDAINEQLSALLDGELSAPESELCLKRLERNAHLKETLSRYALIGEAMRASAPVVATRPGFAQRVGAALETDAPLAPAKVNPTTGSRAPNWWRPAAGLGVAAAVSLLAIVLVGRGTPGAAPVVAAISAAARPAAAR